MLGRVELHCQRPTCLLTRCAWPKPSMMNMARTYARRNSILDAREICSMYSKWQVLRVDPLENVTEKCIAWVVSIAVKSWLLSCCREGSRKHSLNGTQRFTWRRIGKVMASKKTLPSTVTNACAVNVDCQQAIRRTNSHWHRLTAASLYYCTTKVKAIS